jgi:hypothetical protein
VPQFSPLSSLSPAPNAPFVEMEGESPKTRKAKFSLSLDSHQLLVEIWNKLDSMVRCHLPLVHFYQVWYVQNCTIALAALPVFIKVIEGCCKPKLTYFLLS